MKIVHNTTIKMFSSQTQRSTYIVSGLVCTSVLHCGQLCGAEDMVSLDFAPGGITAVKKKQTVLLPEFS